MRTSTDTKVFIYLGKHHWFLAQEYHEQTQKHRMNTAAYQKQAEAHPSSKEYWEGLARHSTWLVQKYQRIADRSLSLSKRYFQLVRTSPYGNALINALTFARP